MVINPKGFEDILDLGIQVIITTITTIIIVKTLETLKMKCLLHKGIKETLQKKARIATES